MLTHKALLTDPALFASFQRGDQQAFFQIYESLKRAIYIFTLRMIGSAPDAEDIAVEAFSRLWERRESIENMSHLRNFLYVATRNRCIHFLQAKRRAQVELTGDVADEIDTSRVSDFRTDELFADLVEEIVALARKMPKIRGMVFRMRYLEDRPVKEVAETLGLSVQNVYWHSKEALAHAREALTKKPFASSDLVFMLALLMPTAVSSLLS